jgi:hypothetical protein
LLDGHVRIAPASLDAFVSGAETARPSPYLNARQAADYLGIALRTLENNRRHIPSRHGFRTRMFDPAGRDRVRSSQTFATRRLEERYAGVFPFWAVTISRVAP